MATSLDNRFGPEDFELDDNDERMDPPPELPNLALHPLFPDLDFLDALLNFFLVFLMFFLLSLLPLLPFPLSQLNRVVPYLSIISDSGGLDRMIASGRYLLIAQR